MRSAEVVVAWILFWLFAAITIVSTFLIVRFHRPSRQALLITGGVGAFFVLLFIGLLLLLRSLGL